MYCGITSWPRNPHQRATLTPRLSTTTSNSRFSGTITFISLSSAEPWPRGHETVSRQTNLLKTEFCLSLKNVYLKLRLFSVLRQNILDWDKKFWIETKNSGLRQNYGLRQNILSWDSFMTSGPGFQSEKMPTRPITILGNRPFFLSSSYHCGLVYMLSIRTFTYPSDFHITLYFIS